MKSKQSLDKNKFKKKKISISKILNEDFFFRNSGNIQMALSKDRLVKRNFKIKRAKSKINTGKKSLSFNLKQNSLLQDENDDNSINRNNKNIPFQLADILDKNKIKFEKVFQTYYRIKNNNNAFFSYWNYVQKINEKLKNKRQIIYRDGTNEYYNTFRKYDFSTRDQIELELQKKLTTNIFKSNPLIIGSNKEMFFHFLNEYKDKNIVFNEQNPTKYMKKLKDLLDYMQTELDYNVNELNIDMQAQNSKYIKEHKKKLEEEKIKKEEEQKKQDIIDIMESKKMIKQTKLALKSLNSDKNFFEDPYFFSNDNDVNINKNKKLSNTFYKKKSRNVLTPNKNDIMSKSTSNFFSEDKNGSNKYNINTIKFLKEKKNKFSKHFSSYLNRRIKKDNKLRKINSSQDTNFSSVFKNKYDKSYSKEISINRFSRNYNRKIINKSNTIDNIIINKKNNINNLPSIKKLPISQSLSSKNENIHKKSNLSSAITPKIESSSNNRSKNNDSSRISIIKSLLNESNNKNSNENKNLENLENHKSIKVYKSRRRYNLYELYDIVKRKKKLSKNNLKKISEFIKQRDIKFKKLKNPVNLLKDIKILSEGYDINKMARNIEDIERYEIKPVKNFKNINIEINNLDKNYISQICDFKAKNKRNDGEEEF